MTASDYTQQLFSIEGKVAIVTGSTGVLGGAMARGLAQAGVKVAILGRRKDKAEAVAQEISAAGGTAIATPADVLDKAQLEAARDQVIAQWGTIDILVNAAGGTTPEATVSPDKTIFDMQLDPMKYVIDLNLIGTLLPAQVFGEVMAQKKVGSIVNISSMNAQRALTRSVAYGASKAALDNLTKFLAVELALKFGAGMRVNAIAPGFFVGDQNRALLLNSDNTLTTRGQTIINHTPAGRFGDPDDLVGALIWLCSPSAHFVNGAVIMVDGGVNAFSGI
ncbi:MAG TPA: SDR family oxidoreductase [Phototrophicaceae bacterium]|nr:SDR family oxidoreductase [Phototrophicaceae bacterium]